MSSPTPWNWSVRPPGWVAPFTSLLVGFAVLAVVHSIWPFLIGKPLAQLLALSTMLLAVVRPFVCSGRSSAIRGQDDQVSRIAAGHWRVTTNDTAVDGTLDHVWYGWGWVTLRVRPFDLAAPVTVTVWRPQVSHTAWHQLRVWTAWELSMVAGSEVSS